MRQFQYYDFVINIISSPSAYVENIGESIIFCFVKCQDKVYKYFSMISHAISLESATQIA